MAIARVCAAVCVVATAALGPAQERTDATAPGKPRRVRTATFNVNLTRGKAGALATELRTGRSPQARAVAEILQRVRPDIVLLNEFDFAPDHVALTAFLEQYLAKSWHGAKPLRYAHRYVAPVNTGVPSGHDLDHDGKRNGAGDAFGYGAFPGQYGMVLLSRFPIASDAVRTFRELPWKRMPGALLPEGWFSSAQLEVVRLSSKSHWDIPVRVDGTTLHLLCAHPTPPVFDGPEDRNGRRNHDEIRLWADYLTPGKAAYLIDDQGQRGGFGGKRFVILGDYNADPRDGDSTAHAIDQLLQHPLVAATAPRSSGGVAAARRQGGANLAHRGDPANDTGDFADRRGPGNLRLDYVLPSRNLRVVGSGVFWPAPGEAHHALVGDGAEVVSSDHRLVWVDLEFER